MANLLDRLLNLMGVDDDDDEQERGLPERVVERPSRGSRIGVEPRAPRGRLISFPAKVEDETSLTKVALCELTDFDQVPEVVTNLRNFIPVVINLRQAGSASAQRILDFLCGVIYAIDGKIAKVEEAIYLLTPKGVDISADLDLLSLDPELDWLNR